MTAPLPHRGPRRPPRVTAEWWKVAGVVLATAVGIAGLVLVAYVVVIFIALANMGSNK